MINMFFIFSCLVFYLLVVRFLFLFIFEGVFEKSYFEEDKSEDPSKSKQKILTQCNPLLIKKNLDSYNNIKPKNEVIHILHGAMSTPLQLKNIFDFVDKKNKYDLYRGLLANHCSTYNFYREITLDKAINNLLVI